MGRASSAKRIHFNLDGFRNKRSSLRDAVRRGRAHEFGYGVAYRTERELYWVLSNKTLRGKTIFYRGGTAVPTPATLFGDVWNIR